MQRSGGGGGGSGRMLELHPHREAWEIPNTIHRAFLVKRGGYELINSARNVSMLCLCININDILSSYILGAGLLLDT